MDLTYLANYLLICCGLILVGSGIVWAFMIIYEAGYDHGYESGKRNYKHALRSEASRVFKN